MESIHKKLDDLKAVSDDNLSKAALETSTIGHYALDCFNLVSDILDLLDSQDRAPKKKIKPLLKSLQTKLLDIGDKIEQNFESLSINEQNSDDLLGAAINRLNAIDKLYMDYTHYKMMHIDDFLEKLDKLVY